MQNNFKYINLSWAVVGICENARQPLLSHIPGIDKKSRGRFSMIHFLRILDHESLRDIPTISPAKGLFPQQNAVL